MVTINQLVDIAENIAGLKLHRNYNLKAPKGVNGRNSDNTLIDEIAGLGTEYFAEGRLWKRLTPGSYGEINANEIKLLGQKVAGAGPYAGAVARARATACVFA